MHGQELSVGGCAERLRNSRDRADPSFSVRIGRTDRK